MLVSSMIGMSLRTTMDIDTSIEALPLSMDKMQEIIDEIINISIEDNVTFEIASIETIMDEFDYPGIRIHMLGHLDKINQPIECAYNHIIFAIGLLSCTLPDSSHGIP